MNRYNLLNSISSPDDLRRLEVDQLPEVCDELGKTLLRTLLQSGALSCQPRNSGTDQQPCTTSTIHLMTVLYGTWDIRRTATKSSQDGVKHSPPTGNWEVFACASPEESEYDPFTCGHASNSISAALGMAVAAAKKGETTNVM